MLRHDPEVVRAIHAERLARDLEAVRVARVTRDAGLSPSIVRLLLEPLRTAARRVIMARCPSDPIAVPSPPPLPRGARSRM